LIKRNNIQYEREPHISNFYSLLKIALIFMVSFMLGYKLHHKDFDASLGYRLGAETLEIVYFTASLSSIVTGLLMVIRRHKIITLVVGYLVIENGLFLLSLAMGNEMPIVVNLGILFDIITTTFLLGIFVSRVHTKFHDDTLANLSELRD
jgi:hydrogenase-4 component E